MKSTIFGAENLRPTRCTCSVWSFSACRFKASDSARSWSPRWFFTMEKCGIFFPWEKHGEIPWKNGENMVKNDEKWISMLLESCGIPWDFFSYGMDSSEFHRRKICGFQLQTCVRFRPRAKLWNHQVFSWRGWLLSTPKKCVRWFSDLVGKALICWENFGRRTTFVLPEIDGPSCEFRLQQMLREKGKVHTIIRNWTEKVAFTTKNGPFPLGGSSHLVSGLLITILLHFITHLWME